MPIPSRKKGEPEQDFIGRCISSIIDEYGQEQAAAICYTKSTEKMSKTDQEELFVIQPRKSEGRGSYITRCSNNSKMKNQFPNMKERLGFCLNSFNAYYKYWSRLEEFNEVPEDSALGMCIAKEKSKGFTYQEAYARCATKSVSPNTTVVLSEDDDDIIEEPVIF
jgi:hypothetical protein